MEDQILNLMDKAGFATPEQKAQAAKVLAKHPKRKGKPIPRDVLAADVEEAARTGRLPADPDRRAAVLKIAEMALILQSANTQ